MQLRWFTSGLLGNIGGFRYSGRRGAIITDSGGFQIFSLAAGELDLGASTELKGAGQKRRPSLVHSVTEHGARFKSYIDGTPFEVGESVVERLGAEKRDACDAKIQILIIIIFRSLQRALLMHKNDSG